MARGMQKAGANESVTGEEREMEDMPTVETYEAMEADLERARAEARTAREQYLRTLADFDNYRKRVERERDEIGAAGKRELLLALLDVADDLERVASTAEVNEEGRNPLVAGVAVIYRKIQRMLENHGVRALESVGRSFDPERHEAIGITETDRVPEGHVVDELSRGYEWNGRLLRPARVMVAG
jgi:molecular chaperone GrpE